MKCVLNKRVYMYICINQREIGNIYPINRHFPLKIRKESCGIKETFSILLEYSLYRLFVL